MSDDIDIVAALAKHVGKAASARYMDLLRTEAVADAIDALCDDWYGNTLADEIKALLHPEGDQ